MIDDLVLPYPGGTTDGDHAMGIGIIIGDSSFEADLATHLLASCHREYGCEPSNARLKAGEVA